MAHTSSHDMFSKLPPEIRIIIFEHFFRSLSITTRTNQRSNLASESGRKNSLCNILLLSQQCRAEITENLLKHATFSVPLESCKRISDIPLQILSAIEHLTITAPELCGVSNHYHAGYCLANQYYRKFFDSNSMCKEKLQTITYEERFRIDDVGQGM